jgi:hypothetical protein
MLNRRLLIVATMMGLLMTPATASDTVFLHAAGSLRGGGVVVTASITNETVDELKRQSP